MAVAETNKIITHGDGQSIATSIQNIANAINDQEKNVHLSDAQTITGAKTFTSPIKTNEIDNTAGNAMLRNKDTEGAIVLGSSAKKAVIMGSGDRPTYSKDGSDFTGSELALKSDVTDLQSDKWKELYANMGIGRWRGTTLYHKSSEPSIMYDSLAKYCTKCDYFMAGSIFKSLGYGVVTSTKPIHFATTDFFTTAKCSYRSAFAEFQNAVDIYMPNMEIADSDYMFIDSKFTKVLIEEGCSCKIYSNVLGMFNYMPNLTEVGAFDMTNAYLRYGGCFDADSKLKSIHCTHWHFSFFINGSTAFEEADLVEILNNLDPVSTTQTLTMGATNLAKLTSDDILIATGKGWALA